MDRRQRRLIAALMLGFVATLAWWRWSAVPAAPESVPTNPAAPAPAPVMQSAAPGEPGLAQPVDQTWANAPRREDSDHPVTVMPERESPHGHPPETSVPGRSLAELERRARAGDAKAARDWVDALLHCRARFPPDRLPPPVRFRSHYDLPGNGEQRAGVVEPGPLSAECGGLIPDAGADRFQWQAMVEEALRLWAATGDPYGQLAASTSISVQWPPPAELWRQQQGWASSHLDPSDPQTLVDLALVFPYGSRFSSAEAWRLAACDLGYDCSAGGALQTSLCLRRDLCEAGTYQAHLLDTLPPRRWQLVQAQRRALLEMLRRGDARGVFDVPPPGG